MSIKKTPKVAFIYHFLPDYREPVFQALLDDPRIECDFISGDDKGEFSSIPSTENIPFIEVKNKWYRSILWQSDIVRLIRENQYDVVVFRGSWLTLSTWIGTLYARLKGKKVLFWMIAWRRKESGLKGYLRPKYLRLAHALLLYGDRSRVLGEQHGYPASRMRVIGNSLPVEVNELEEIREPTGSLNVLWITRIIPYKKPKVLIDAIAIAHRKGHPISCAFVGKSDMPELPSYVDQLGLTKYIEFTGRLPDDDARMEKLLEEARAVVVPGHAGLTVAFGLVRGIPVIVNDNPNSNPPEWEYVHPKENSLGGSQYNGSHFIEDDPESLADELIKWCVTHPANTESKKQIAIDARHEVSPQRSANLIVDAIYEYLH